MLLLGLAAVGLVFVTGQAAVIEFGVPAAALVAGLALHRRQPAAYVALTWWAFFLAPALRRVVDYATDYSAASPVMLAPYLLVAPAAVEAVRSLPLLRRRELLPFGLALAGVLFGYAVGVLKHGLAAPTFDLLEWAGPVCFGLYTVRAWGAYPLVRDAVQRAFTWGVLVVGVYGVVQFFALPPWDAFWMEHAGMRSIGLPEPLKVRVFSTLNAPGPLASVLVAGLVLLLAGRGAGRWPAAAAGYAALLLSLVRTAWLGWAVGVVVLVARSRPGRRGRLVVALALVGALGLSLSSLHPALNVVGARLDTMGDVGADHSLRERIAFLAHVGEAAFVNPLGNGLGSTGRATKLTTGETTVFDNGVANVPYVLGWPGGLLYAGGVLLLIAGALRGLRGAPGRRPAEGVATALVAVGVATLAQMLSANTLVGLSGMVFWGFTGLAVAERVWRTAQGPPDDAPAPDGPAPGVDAGRPLPTRAGPPARTPALHIRHDAAH